MTTPTSAPIEEHKTDSPTNSSMIKLLKIGIPSVIAVACAAVVGGSWFTGKYIENNYKQWVANINDELITRNAEVRVTDFDRGLFSSLVTFRVRMDNKDSFDGSSKIYHGPLPLNRFIPSLASAETQITTPAQFKDFVSNAELLKGKTNVSFTGNLANYFELSPLSGRSPDGTGKFQATPLKINATYDPKSKNGEAQIGLERVSFSDPMAQADLEGLQIDMDFNPINGYRELYAGKSAVNVKRLSGRTNDRTAPVSDITLSNVAVSGNVDVKGARAEQNAILSVGNAVVNGLNAGKAELDLSANVDAEILERLVQQVQNDGEPSEQLIEELFNNKPNIQVKKLALENKGGKALFDMNLNVRTDNIQKSTNSEEAVLNTLAGSTVNLSLERDYAFEAVKFASALQGANPSDAANIATMAVRGLFAGAESMNTFFQVKDNRLQFNLALEPKDIVVNGVKLSEKDKLDAMKLAFLSKAFDDLDLSNLNIDTSELNNVFANINSGLNSATTISAPAPKLPSMPQMPSIQPSEKVQSVETAPISAPASTDVALDPACQLTSGADELAFIQGCLRTNPNDDQLLTVINTAKSQGACSVAQRLYANKGQNNSRIALAYAKEYDPQFAGNNSCFNSNKNTAKYWYETVLEMEPSNSEARSRLMELGK